MNVDSARSGGARRIFLLVLLLVGVVLLYVMIGSFILEMTIAAVFSILFDPLYKGILAKLGGRESVSALLCCLIVILGLIIPLYFVADIVAHEAIDFYRTAEHKIKDTIKKGDDGPLGDLKQHRWVKQYAPDDGDWQPVIRSLSKRGGALVAKAINKTARELVRIIVNVVIILFALFYFLRDGDALVRWLKKMVPLEESEIDQLLERFTSVSGATIKGTVVVGAVQGTFGAITFWAFGFDSPILWGVIMVLLSIIPMVGAGLVLYPAALTLILTGDVLQGVVFLLISVLVVANVDNILRPSLVGREAGLHDLLVFLSTLGGISTFGIFGFVVGPVIVALVLAVLEILHGDDLAQTPSV